MGTKTINAEMRSDFGKNVNNRLRSAGFIPAVIYSHGKTESIKISSLEFFKLFKGNISESVIFNINIAGSKEGASQMAYIKDYQANPVTGDITHLDLFKVTTGEKITTMVPVEVIGNAKGVKMGGVLEIGDRNIEIECLPRNLPEKITVDVTDLDFGQSIHAKDIKISDDIKIVSNPEAVLAAVHAARKADDAVAVESTETTSEAAQ
jgi:large subunit ribosomal protein L25